MSILSKNIKNRKFLYNFYFFKLIKKNLWNGFFLLIQKKDNIFLKILICKNRNVAKNILSIWLITINMDKAEVSHWICKMQILLIFIKWNIKLYKIEYN